MKPSNQTQLLEDLLLMIMKDEPNGVRLTDFQQKLNNILTSKGGPDCFHVGSRHTIISALMRLQEKGTVTRDIKTRRYKITPKGEEYLEKLEIIKNLLASTSWESYFSWNPSSKEPEIRTYSLIEADKTETDHCMSLLRFRLQRLNMLSWQGWFKTVVDYSVEMNLLDQEGMKILAKLESRQESIEDLTKLLEKVEAIWQTIFKDIKRMMIVQSISPELMLARIKSELYAIGNCAKLAEK